MQDEQPTVLLSRYVGMVLNGNTVVEVYTYVGTQGDRLVPTIARSTPTTYLPR